MDIKAVKKQLKALKAEKGKIARQFKDVESGSDEHQALVAKMQEVSTAVKDLEAEQKALLKAQNTEQETSAKAALPGQFAQPEATYNGNFSVSRIGEDGDLTQWWEFVSAHKHASVYHKQDIWQFLTSQPYTTGEVLIARDDNNKVIGGLPLIFLTTPLLGNFGVSLPFFNYGGPVTRFENVFAALLEVCENDAKKGDAKYTEIRTTAKSRFEASTKKVSMLRALPDSGATFDNEIGAKVRAQVKKAEPYRPKFKVGKQELLDDFYDVFARNMRDLGTPVNDKRFFSTLMDVLPDQTFIAVAYVNDQPVATGFLLINGSMMEIPWASTIRDANKMNMNMWLYHQILHFAIEKNMQWFDFGRSTQDAGTYRFKKQWGAEPLQHYWYNFSAEPSGDSLNPDNPKFKLAIAVWQRLPVWLTRRIGPFLSRQLP